MSPRRSLVLVTLLSLGCGAGNGAGGGKPETWTGTLTGTNAVSDFNCPNGNFSESATFTLTVPSSLTAAIRVPYNMDAEIRSGTGHFTGDEGIGTQCGSAGPYTIIASHTDTDVVVDIASVVNDSGPTPEINFYAPAGSLFPFHLHQTTTGADTTIDDEYCDLLPTNVTDGQITGTWKGSGGGSASGNHARGTFTLTKQ